MTLEEFCKQSGVTLIDCDNSWGGKIGYMDAEYPNCSWNGFKTKKAAYKAWLADTFGERPAQTIIKLLKEQK